MKPIVVIAAAILYSAVATPVGAQKRVVSFSGGSLFRYSGDTIWLERDTTVSRTIYHGDTVIRTTSVNDHVRSSLTFVAFGDSARVIAAQDSLGRPASTRYAAVPRRSMNMERDMLALELRMQSTRAQMRDYGVGTQLDPPFSSEMARRYAISEMVTIVQSRDTIRYVRGCPSKGPADTTVFILYSADSLKRVSPPRMFGEAMALSILGQMRLAMGRERMAAQAPAPADLPGLRDPCAGK